MDLKKRIEEKSEEIEKVLITLIFLSVLFSVFFREYAEPLAIVTIVIQVALILFYFTLVEVRIYSLFWAGFLLQITTYFFAESIPQYLYFALNIAPYFVFGILVLVRGLKMSVQNKNFELLTFIMGFLLVFQVALPFIIKNKEVFTFYTFALSFALGTIVYNDNLWHRYIRDEKNIIKYILIVILTVVIQTSVNFI